MVDSVFNTELSGCCHPSVYLESVRMLGPRSVSLNVFHCPNFLAAKAKNKIIVWRRLLKISQRIKLNYGEINDRIGVKILQRII